MEYEDGVRGLSVKMECEGEASGWNLKMDCGDRV
jgi:hypothetical protein